MTDLDELLTLARDADPATRIGLRDPIVARGGAAMLASWDDAVQVGDVVVAPNLPE